MADTDTRGLPLFPSVIFIVAPILGITGLLVWATIQNRRGYGIRRHLQRIEEAEQITFSKENAPILHEIWIDNNLGKAQTHGERDARGLLHYGSDGQLGDERPLWMLVQMPLSLRPVPAEQPANTMNYDTLAALIRMPDELKSISISSTASTVNEPGAEVLIGTSHVRIHLAGESPGSAT